MGNSASANLRVVGDDSELDAGFKEPSQVNNVTTKVEVKAKTTGKNFSGERLKLHIFQIPRITNVKLVVFAIKFVFSLAWGKQTGVERLIYGDKRLEILC